MKCKKCNKEIQDGFKFCPYCSASVEITYSCPKCGATDIPKDSKFCPDCGYELVDVSKSDSQSTKVSKKNEALNIINSNIHGFRLYAYRNKKTSDINNLTEGDYEDICKNKSNILRKVSLKDLNAEELWEVSRQNPLLPNSVTPSVVNVNDPHIFVFFDSVYYVSDDFRRGSFVGTITSADGRTARMNVINKDGEGMLDNIKVYHPNGEVACIYHMHELGFMQVKSMACYNTYGLGISVNTFQTKFLPRYENQLQSLENIRYWGLGVQIS